MSLPGNIPTYNSVPLIDLDTFEYLIAVRQPHWTLRAWELLRETERRWTMFDWATFVVHEPGRCHNLFRDFASAYLFSFEATLQVLKIEKPALDLKSWLRDQPSYDVICKGLRGLRNTGAHVRQVSVTPDHQRSVISRFAHTTTGGTTAWAWPGLTAADLTALSTPHLSVADLPLWNSQSADLLTLGLMRHGVLALRSLLEVLEPPPRP